MFELRRYLRDFEVETIGLKETSRRCSDVNCGAKLKDTVLDWEVPMTLISLFFIVFSSIEVHVPTLSCWLSVRMPCVVEYYHMVPLFSS